MDNRTGKLIVSGKVTSGPYDVYTSDGHVFVHAGEGEFDVYPLSQIAGKTESKCTDEHRELLDVIENARNSTRGLPFTDRRERMAQIIRKWIVSAHRQEELEISPVYGDLIVKVDDEKGVVALLNEDERLGGVQKGLPQITNHDAAQQFADRLRDALRRDWTVIIERDTMIIIPFPWEDIADGIARISDPGRLADALGCSISAAKTILKTSAGDGGGSDGSGGGEGSSVSDGTPGQRGACDDRITYVDIKLKKPDTPPPPDSPSSGGNDTSSAEANDEVRAFHIGCDAVIFLPFEQWQRQKYGISSRFPYTLLFDMADNGYIVRLYQNGNASIDRWEEHLSNRAAASYDPARDTLREAYGVHAYYNQGHGEQGRIYCNNAGVIWFFTDRFVEHHARMEYEDRSVYPIVYIHSCYTAHAIYGLPAAFLDAGAVSYTGWQRETSADPWYCDSIDRKFWHPLLRAGQSTAFAVWYAQEFEADQALEPNNIRQYRCSDVNEGSDGNSAAETGDSDDMPDRSTIESTERNYDDRNYDDEIYFFA